MKLSEATIQQQTSDNSYSRGEDYYHSGAVRDLVQRGNLIQAEVEGSDFAPYRVTLQVDSGEITSASCTCPYDFGGWCKHIVAAALTCVRQPDRLEARPTLAQLLDRLDFVQTQRLVQALVEMQPDLIEQVDRQVLMMTNPAPPKQAAQPRQSPINVAPFRQRVKQILREGLRYLEEGYEDDPFTEELQAVIDQALTFAQNGDGHSAIAILETITSTYADEWDELSDYGSDCYSIAEALDQAWTEAILSAELVSSEAIDLGVMLADWQDAIDADFSMSLAALQQGWNDPELQRALQGESYSNPDRLETAFGQDLALIRLQILDRQNREQEYLNLARTEGLMLQYLTRLAQMGNIEAAMNAAQAHMNMAEEAFALAKTLQEGNHFAEALAIAQAGLSLTGSCRTELASWTSELAEKLGDRSAALGASTIAFETRPNFADYRRIEQFAATEWPQLKPKLLEVLRSNQDWNGAQAKVDIFLHEELIDDAIAAVQTDGYYRSELVLRVMRAAVSVRPDWVIEEAGHRAESIIDRGKADRYQEAVQWLQQVKAAYLHSEQRSQWTAYFTQLQTTHARKRKLMELFKQLQ